MTERTPLECISQSYREKHGDKHCLREIKRFYKFASRGIELIEISVDKMKQISKGRTDLDFDSHTSSKLDKIIKICREFHNKFFHASDSDRKNNKLYSEFEDILQVIVGIKGIMRSVRSMAIDSARKNLRQLKDFLQSYDVI